VKAQDTEESKVLYYSCEDFDIFLEPVESNGVRAMFLHADVFHWSPYVKKKARAIYRDTLRKMGRLSVFVDGSSPLLPKFLSKVTGMAPVYSFPLENKQIVIWSESWEAQ
jgi:hypothetical protein